MKYRFGLKAEGENDEVSTIRVSGWVKEASLIQRRSLSHPLTRTVLTPFRAKGLRTEGEPEETEAVMPHGLDEATH